jgi:hypothetical protein
MAMSSHSSVVLTRTVASLLSTRRIFLMTAMSPTTMNGSLPPGWAH